MLHAPACHEWLHTPTANRRNRSLPPQGLTSLLAEGALAVIPRLSAAPRPPPPLPLRPPHAAAPLPHRLLLQQAGAAAPLKTPPTDFAAGRMQHHATVRGHRLAVYCTALDRTGRLVITGADDYLVKVRAGG